MNAELAILYQVQQLDTEIAQLVKALSSLDSGRELEQEIVLLQAELAELRGQQQAAEKENLDRELETRTLQEKRKRFSDQLYSGKVGNPRQLADLQGEVDMLGREARRVEDRMLELMEIMELHRGKITAQEAQLSARQEQLAAVRTRYDEAGTRLRADLSRLEEIRAQTARQISSVVLKRYEQIRVRSGNIGLVKITGAQCPGCRISLPSETLKYVKVGRSGLTCENCGRLLFWDEESKSREVEELENNES